MIVQRIAGVDEAGRGPLAGPVVAAAVVFPHEYSNSEIRDSKQLSAKSRKRLVEIIKQDALQFSIVAVGPRRIENLNILEATRLAMRLALQRVDADYARIDGNARLSISLPHETVIKGDQKHVEISAASILAKEWRDSLMTTIANKYPAFDFNLHAGYPTPKHKSAVAEHGPCLMHRLTFRGVREHSALAKSELVRCRAEQLLLLM
jgi:ribonuclease HII